ncbi:MAG: Holliday junction branch migration protein RuvA [Phycisphaeraceae bacterium]|nr:Holliday junction branch migration protein RuvA [Phycisphaeraceae bacterium]
MIARIEGTLEAIIDHKALVSVPGGLTYEVDLPAFTATRLAPDEGKPVVLETRYFIEGGNTSTMEPKLAGFASIADREFFDLFITCRGIGHRKALRAMAIEPGQIAAAIDNRDADTLKTLPEVGKRTAETIIATLHGKVDDLIDAAAAGAGVGGGKAPESGVAAEAIQVLVQLGESRTDAERWVQEALKQADEEPADADELVELVYRVRK